MQGATQDKVEFRSLRADDHVGAAEHRPDRRRHFFGDGQDRADNGDAKGADQDGQHGAAPTAQQIAERQMPQGHAAARIARV